MTWLDLKTLKEQSKVSNDNLKSTIKARYWSQLETGSYLKSRIKEAFSNLTCLQNPLSLFCLNLPRLVCVVFC